MPRRKTPAILALTEGRHLEHAGRYNGRNSAEFPPIGPAPDWLDQQQVAAWDDLRATLPWLQTPHTGITAIAAVLLAQLRTDAAMSVGAMNLLRLCLGQLGATPADFAKIAWSPPEDDPDDEIFDR